MSEETSGSPHWTRRLPPLFHLLVTLQFLTRLPVPRDLNPTIKDLARSSWSFPLVGAIVGGLLAGTALLLLKTPMVTALAAALLMIVGVMLTGAFHEDGLADAADGFGGGWRVEDVLRIMRDSRLGTYGSITLMLVVGLRYVSLLGMETSSWSAALICAHTLGRFSSLVLLKTLPYAREEGGTAKPLVEYLSWSSLLLGFFFTALAISSSPLIQALAALLLALLITALSGLYFRQRLGGMTGDCLGATNVLCEVGVMVLFAAWNPTLSSPWVAAL